MLAVIYSTFTIKIVPRRELQQRPAFIPLAHSYFGPIMGKAPLKPLQRIVGVQF